jgi:hypothetical protein
MTDPRDYNVDITGLAPDGRVRAAAPPRTEGTRPFLGIHFACCGVYLHIYRNAEGTEYAGNCPRCGKPVRFEIGPGGTDQRQFTVE